MKNYEAYIFDLYGTLIDIWTDENDPYLWQQMAELYACCGADYTPEALKVSYRRMVAEEQDRLGALNGAQHPEIKLETVFWRLYREAPVKHRASLSLRGKKEQELWLQMLANSFRSLSTRRFRLYPHVKDVLTALRAQGHAIYLLSNAQRIFTAPEMEKLGLTDFFDGIRLSSDFGMAKPEAAFLEALLKEKKLAPDACVMVGNDWQSDMTVAAKCGVDGIFLNTGRFTEEQIRAGLPKGRFRVIQSGDLAELLK